MDLYYWNLFCQDYNLEHLNKISNGAINIIKSFLNKNVKFKGLQRILKLYFVNNFSIPHVNILTDIISLSYHIKDDIKIYIFGEHHYPTEKCSKTLINQMNVFNFIKLNIENIPKFIDIFLETAYIDKYHSYDLYQAPGKTLLKFETEYRGCLDPIKKCQISNVRFHNTDIRLPKINKLPFIPYIHNIMFHIDKTL